MEGQHPLQPDLLRALGDGRAPARGRPDVVAGREEMAGIDAHTEPVWTRGATDELAKLAEAPAERAASTRGVLQGDSDPVAGRAPRRLVQRRRDTREAGINTGAPVRAGV